MNFENISKQLLFFCFIFVAGFGYSQSPEVTFKQEDFKIFSEQYTTFRLEIFWESMYADYRFKPVARDSMPSGVINVCMRFNKNGDTEMYFDNYIGFGVCEELERVLNKNIDQVKPITENVTVIAKFGFGKMDSIRGNKDFADCHLIFVFTNKYDFIRYRKSTLTNYSEIRRKPQVAFQML